MMVANKVGKCKADAVIEEWVHEEGPTIVADILARMPSAVRQNITTLDVMEGGRKPR